MVCRVPEKLLQRSRSDFLRRHQVLVTDPLTYAIVRSFGRWGRGCSTETYDQPVELLRVFDIGRVTTVVE